jgi:hypothetical protein
MRPESISPCPPLAQSDSRQTTAYPHRHQGEVVHDYVLVNVQQPHLVRSGHVAVVSVSHGAPCRLLGGLFPQLLDLDQRPAEIFHLLRKDFPCSFGNVGIVRKALHVHRLMRDPGPKPRDVFLELSSCSNADMAHALCPSNAPGQPEFQFSPCQSRKFNCLATSAFAPGAVRLLACSLGART